MDRAREIVRYDFFDFCGFMLTESREIPKGKYTSVPSAKKEFYEDLGFEFNASMSEFLVNILLHVGARIEEENVCFAMNRLFDKFEEWRN
tara:strand:+ start:616 stop:885 length:270 start_codon:yes stop_codon:yes gene_type:complete